MPSHTPSTSAPETSATSETSTENGLQDAPGDKTIQQTEQHESHRLAWLEDTEHGIQVPVTEIHQLDAPDGTPNHPLQVYRTMGPGSVPEEGLSLIHISEPTRQVR